MNVPLSPRIVALGSWIVITALVSASLGSLSIELISSILVNMTPLLLLSLVAAVIISCGEIDISIGAVLGFAGSLIVFLSVIGPSGVWWVSLAHCVVAATMASVYFGVSQIVRVGVSSLILSISILLVAKGASTLLHACLQGAGSLCRGVVSRDVSAVLEQRHVMTVMAAPLFALVLMVGAVMLVKWLRERTRWGLEHVAVGMDKDAAVFARVSPAVVKRRAFLFASALLFVAVVARLHGQNGGGWSANTGWGEEILAIAVAVIGGTRITGGRIDPIAIGLAALAVYFTRDVVTNDFGIPAEASSIVFGAVLLVIVLVDLGVGWSSERRTR